MNIISAACTISKKMINKIKLFASKSAEAFYGQQKYFLIFSLSTNPDCALITNSIIYFFWIKFTVLARQFSTQYFEMIENLLADFQVLILRNVKVVCRIHNIISPINHTKFLLKMSNSCTVEITSEKRKLPHDIYCLKCFSIYTILVIKTLTV